MSIFVSICIPTFNGQKFLRETIDSVLAQTYENFEILIVDDQSTDNTYPIAMEYAEKDERMRLVRNPKNLGLVENWNRCIELAQGEWIKFVFQDDLIAPECLEKMLSATSSACPIIFCCRNFIFDDTITEQKKAWFLAHKQTINDLFLDLGYIPAETYSKCMLKDFGLNIVGEPTVVLVHRSAFLRFGTFNSNLIQLCDYEFWSRVAVHTGITFLPETLATFRVHEDATTTKNHKIKHYRTNDIDNLVYWHELVFSPMYMPSRLIAGKYYPSMDLTLAFKNLARSAWLKARKSSDSSLITEWNKISESYPAIQLMARRTYGEEIVESVRTKLIIYKKFLMTALKNLVKNALMAISKKSSSSP